MINLEKIKEIMLDDLSKKSEDIENHIIALSSSMINGAMVYQLYCKKENLDNMWTHISCCNDDEFYEFLAKTLLACAINFQVE